MESRIVIVAYKPKPGKEQELKRLALTHHEQLSREGLVTDRKPILMQSEDGTIVEVFEWKSAEAIKKAHTNEAVDKMWMEFSTVCDYIPIGLVGESNNVFAEFAPVI